MFDLDRFLNNDRSELEQLAGLRNDEVTADELAELASPDFEDEGYF